MATLTNTGAVSADEIVPSNFHPRVLRLQHGIVNTYLVGEPGGSEWSLIDAGLAPTSGWKIIRAAEQRFGSGVAPTALVLTHGHFDHVGGIHPLLERWDVPVYAHELELPYLTGRSAYPPPDPTVGGGCMSRMASLFPRGPIDLGQRVRPLPADGLIPGMPGWRWIHTPGHSPGHISLFRFSDHMLIAGDAFVTVQQESLLAVMFQHPQVHRPPAYFTPDWGAARKSIATLLALEPEVAATGHGLPMSGQVLREQLRALLDDFEFRSVPRFGRYVNRPAISDESGVISVPPPVADPFPGIALSALAVITAVVVASRMQRRRRPMQLRRG